MRGTHTCSTTGGRALAGLAWTLLVVMGIQLVLPDIAEGRRRRRRPATGKLEVHSMTEGAAVTVDGEEVGQIPLPGPIRLKPGKHTLKISKRGYTEYLDVFTIRRGKTTSLDINLLPYAGIVGVTTSVPDARVFIDGKYVGTSPLEHEVLIGERTVRIAKAGYYDVVTQIKSIAGKTQTLHAKLKPLPVGSSPYRPKPPPPPKWYEKWYVWAGAAGGVAAVTLAIVIPIALSNDDPIGEFNHDFRWQVP